MMITPTVLVVLLLSLPFLLQAEGAGSGVRHKRVLKGSATKHARKLDSDDDKFEKEKDKKMPDRATTAAPTPTPTPPPTPSPAPTSTFAPTTLPLYTVTTEVADGFGNLVTQAECDSSNLYNDSNSPQVEQLVSYQYQLTTTASANPVTAARSIESRLQTLLARKVLDCVYSDTAMRHRGILEFWSVSSQPVDRLHRSSSNECETTTSSSAVDCYIIRGGLTVNFFALVVGNDGGKRRSLLQEEITDVRVVDTLGPILRDLFGSGQLKDEYGEIVDLQWMDFTNVAIPGEEAGLEDDDIFGNDNNSTDANTEDRGDTSAPGATGSDALASSSSTDDRSLKAIPILALSFTIVSLLAVIVLVWKRRRDFGDQARKARVEATHTPNSTSDDASLFMQQSFHSDSHARLKTTVAGTMNEVEVDVAESSMMSEEMPPPRDYRMRETDTGTSCGMDMELLSAKLEKNDSSLWYPYEKSREESLTTGYSYDKGPDKVYVLEDCQSFEESTINLGPNFAADFSVNRDDSFRRPTFIKPDSGLNQSSFEKSMEDLKPHESLSMDNNRRFYASHDTVVL